MCVEVTSGPPTLSSCELLKVRAQKAARHASADRSKEKIYLFSLLSSYRYFIKGPRAIADSSHTAKVKGRG